MGLAGLVGLAADPSSTGASPRGADDALTYALVDTWTQAPWQLTAGRFAEAADVSSAPDGTIFLLDSHQRAIHVLGSDGRARHVFPVFRVEENYQGWQPTRLDAGWDGSVYLLSMGRRLGESSRARVDRFAASGLRLSSLEIELDPDMSYQDIAIHPDGEIYLSRASDVRPPPYPCLGETPAPTTAATPSAPATAPPAPTATPAPTGLPSRQGVDVRDGQGRLVAAIALACPPDSLDVDRGGKLFLVQRCADPGPPPCPTVGPTATARPSLAFAPDQDTTLVAESGVFTFAPGGLLDGWVPFNGAEDIAVGPAGVFVARHVEIFALGESEPLFSGPAGQIVGPIAGRTVFHLDVPTDGRLLASMNHCAFQGLAVFNQPAQRPSEPELAGALDRPELEGPVYPLRIAASDELAVLLGRYLTWGPRPNQEYQLATSGGLPQSVQRWLRRGIVPKGGRLASQLGVCGGSDAWWTHDVAMDGRTVYTIDPHVLQRRPDDRLPAWSYWPGAWAAPGEHPWLGATAANDGQVAVLDVGTRRVRVLDEAMQVRSDWPVGGPGVNTLPVDIALAGGQLFLADLGQNQIRVYAPDGTLRSTWPTHDGPRQVAAGPDGDVYVLGGGRWAYRYSADGRLRAAWPLPDRQADPLDIAVDDAGHVYVSFVELVPQPPRDLPTRGWFGATIRRAGVWVFEARPLPPQPETVPDACLARPDKRAAPRRIPLGNEVEVTLEVAGRCPGQVDRAQIVLAFDVSRSMSFNSALDRARAGVMSLLGSLDARSTEVGLVTFAEGATLETPLTRDLGAIRARIAGLAAWDNTRLGPGIATAQAELTGARGDPRARRILMVVTDGIPKDDPLPAAQAARAAGLELVLLVYPTSQFNETHLAALRQLVADPAYVIVDPDRPELDALLSGLTGYHEPEQLFETIAIEDVIPANMRFVEGSARPPAELRGGTTLFWRLPAVRAGEPLRLTYRLIPLQVGRWPTNVQATAEYRDALGSDGRLIFPIPEVEVYASTARLYLPFAAASQCFRATAVDVVLVLDTSSSMLDPAADGQGTKLDAARGAAETFLVLLRLPADHAAIVSFNRSAEPAVELTGDREELLIGLAGLSSQPGTRIDLGLAGARKVLARGARSTTQSVVILLTDGLQNGPTEPVRVEAEALKATGALVYTIGLGGAIDRALLQTVASSADRAFESPGATELTDIYRQISDRLACDTADWGSGATD